MSLPGSTLPLPRLMAPDEGENWWFLGTLQQLKLGGDDTGQKFTVLEFLAPAGFGAPLHRHDVEDELVYVVSGTVTFWCAGQQRSFGPGGLVWLPHGLPHRFQVAEAGPARLLRLSTPAQFDQFVKAVGEPAPAPELPDPSPAKIHHLTNLAAEFQIEILPPV